MQSSISNKIKFETHSAIFKLIAVKNEINVVVRYFYELESIDLIFYKDSTRQLNHFNLFDLFS